MRKLISAAFSIFQGKVFFLLFFHFFFVHCGVESSGWNVWWNIVRSMGHSRTIFIPLEKHDGKVEENFVKFFFCFFSILENIYKIFFIFCVCVVFCVKTCQENYLEQWWNLQDKTKCRFTNPHFHSLDCFELKLNDKRLPRSSRRHP